MRDGLAERIPAAIRWPWDFPKFSSTRSSETTGDVVLHRNPSGSTEGSTNSSKDHATAMGWPGCCCLEGGDDADEDNAWSGSVLTSNDFSSKKIKVHDPLRGA